MSDNDSYNMEIKKIREKIFQEIREKETQFCSAIEELWLIMFDKNKEVIQQRYQTIFNHLTELYDGMLEEEQENVQELRESLELLVVESEALKTELSLNIQLPFTVDINGVGIKQQKEKLEEFLEKYKQIRSERISALETCKEQERELCSQLGADPMYSMFNDVPSEAKLKEIKTHLRNLKATKESRYTDYVKTINEIDDLMNELEISQVSNFEKMALDKNNEFQLSEKNMQTLQDWKERLENQMESENKLATELRDKISLLWDRLDIDHDERERFIVKTAKSCGKSVLKELRDEIRRCEDLKKANIETVILRLRNDIVDLWDRCHIGEEERNSFDDFYSTDYNEELLESHERKAEALQAFYGETSNLYALAEKWFELWNKMISLENRSNNTERLNNRGGQLLKEERERKRIQKELPKVETKLEKLIQKFESTHNRSFLYNGIPLMVLISEYWDNRRLEKENEKEVRKIQNATKITPLKHVNRAQTTATSSALSSRKRVRPLTPVEYTTSQKQPVRRQLKMTKPKTETITRRRSRSHDPAGRYGSNMNLRSASANSSVVSYAGFQNYIETKSRVKTHGMPLRSSLSPSRSGSNENVAPKSGLYRTPSNIATPVTKRSRLQTTYSNSKLPRLRPMIN